ncbi:MAG TPA: type III secretion system chaperone [Candidatus Dormibacteraeota bacterium]|jgi:hypothetical protein|nr:type III secretion system chaperone [Candidatus Dormibacteraeota bacterium]
MTPERAAAEAALTALLADHSDLASRRLDEDRWLLVLEGEVRQRIPVLVELGRRTCTLSSFLLRGPRAGAARLHEVLLRKNLATSRLRFALDGDGDVVLIARIALASTTVAELENVLGEIHSLGESGFEGLVHIGYPGVFPPLRRSPPHTAN